MFRSPHRPARGLVLFALLAACVPPAGADDPPTRVTAAERPVPSRVTSAALFKNGIGFLVREARIPGDGAPFVLASLPTPVHGTFWATVPGRAGALRSIEAYWRTGADSLPAASPGELLAANLGRQVEVRLTSGEVLRGTVLEAGASAPPPAPFGGATTWAPPAPGSLVLLRSGGSHVAFGAGSVDRVSTSDGAPLTWRPRERREPALRVRTQGAGGQPLRVHALARGISWAPSYIVELADDARARLVARAEIVNDLEDLERVPVWFVTGYPNVRFANVDDPIGLAGDLASFLAALRGERTGIVGNVGVLSQMAYLDRDESRRDRFTIEPGQTIEEMHLYGPQEVSLRKGERGYYPMFDLEVPCEHRYTLHPGDLLAARAPDPQDPGPGREPVEDVWHSVRLENTGKVPWTTAPAAALESGQLLAQDVLPNTPPGGHGTLRITKALDLRAEAEETETERKRNHATYYGYAYDLVQVRGRMTVISYRDSDVKLEVTKDVSGEVLGSTPSARVETTARGLRAINPQGVLTWELPLKARGRIEIEYRYQILLRQ